MRIVQGQSQTAAAGTVLPIPLRVQVFDSTGAIVPRQVVNFHVVAGDGSMFAGVNITDDSGVAQDIWTVGTVAGDSQAVEARAVDNQTGQPLTFATFIATAIPGPPASSRSVVTVAHPVADSLQTDTVVLRARDAFGNALSVGGATVAFTASTGPGVSTGSFGPTADRQNGTYAAAFSALQPGLPTTIGSLINGSAVTESLPTIQVFPIAAASVVVAPAFPRLDRGSNVQLTAAVLDAAGDTLVGRSVMWTTVDTSIATVSPTGLALTRAYPGTTAILATSGSAVGVDSITTTIQYVSIAMGGIQSCATTTDAGTYCWGYGADGEMGNGGTVDAGTSVPVTGGLGLHGVTAGRGDGMARAQNCALSADGHAYCWGWNGNGQLGDGTTTDRSVPVAVAGGHVFTQLAAGIAFTCGLESGTGSAYCWGQNTAGQLGDGTLTNSLTPVQVGGGMPFVSLTSGADHACGLQASGQGFCWGNDNNGQLGDGDSVVEGSPVPVFGGFTFSQIVSGHYHTCGLAASTVYCWGWNNAGQLGSGDSLNRFVPTPVPGSFAAVSPGLEFSCALDGAGQAYCWGSDGDGGLGIGQFTGGTVQPVAVTGGLTFTSIAVGGHNVCGIAGGQAYCWGINAHGSLGIGLGAGGRSKPRLLPFQP